MARQTYYVTREQKHPLYRTRMLQAGPLELDASAARLFRKLGVELSEEAPKRAARAEAPASIDLGGGVRVEEKKAETDPPTVTKTIRAPRQKAPARKATRRKKS